MLVWLGVLAIGLSLGLLGGGGSILTVPLLIYGFGIEIKAAMATSLLVVGVTSTLTTVLYSRRRQVCGRVGLTFGVAAMLGAFAGGSVAHFIPARALLLLFVVLMLGTGLAMLRGRAAGEALTASRRAPCAPALALPLTRILFFGVLIGATAGLVGAGGGFLVVPALHLLGRLPMRAAIGTSVLVIAMQSLAGFAAYQQHVSLDYPLVGILTLVASMGTLLGGTAGVRLNGTYLKRGFGVFVLSIAGYSLYRELNGDWILQRLLEQRASWFSGVVLVSLVVVLAGVLVWQITRTCSLAKQNTQKRQIP